MYSIVDAELTPGDADGERFLSDIAGMLERIAEVSRLVLTLHERTGSHRSWRVAAARQALSALLPEVGIHRGQLARGATGRVLTYTVAVTIRAPLAQASSESIIRTYNYPLKRVSFHRSGTQADLEEVLAGKVRDRGESAPDASP